MNKIDCYKCNIEPSVLCGECPVWLADEEVSEKERIAYRQGGREFAEWLQEKVIINIEFCTTLVGEKEYPRLLSFLELLDIWQKEENNEGKTMRGPCSKCKRIDTCKDKIDVRTVGDDIKYGMVVPYYVPGPDAECLS